MSVTREPMTDHELRALRILVHWGFSRAGEMGEALSVNPSPRMPQHYARPGGRVLRRLTEKGYARHASERWGWVPTSAGVEAAQ